MTLAIDAKRRWNYLLLQEDPHFSNYNRKQDHLPFLDFLDLVLAAIAPLLEGGRCKVRWNRSSRARVPLRVRLTQAATTYAITVAALGSDASRRETYLVQFPLSADACRMVVLPELRRVADRILPREATATLVWLTAFAEGRRRDGGRFKEHAAERLAAPLQAARTVNEALNEGRRKPCIEPTGNPIVWLSAQLKPVREAGRLLSSVWKMLWAQEVVNDGGLLEEETAYMLGEAPRDQVQTAIERLIRAGLLERHADADSTYLRPQGYAPMLIGWALTLIYALFGAEAVEWLEDPLPEECETYRGDAPYARTELEEAVAEGEEAEGDEVGGERMRKWLWQLFEELRARHVIRQDETGISLPRAEFTFFPSLAKGGHPVRLRPSCLDEEGLSFLCSLFPGKLDAYHDDTRELMRLARELADNDARRAELTGLMRALDQERASLAAARREVERRMRQQ